MMIARFSTVTCLAFMTMAACIHIPSRREQAQEEQRKHYQDEQAERERRRQAGIPEEESPRQKARRQHLQEERDFRATQRQSERDEAERQKSLGNWDDRCVVLYSEGQRKPDIYVRTSLRKDYLRAVEVDLDQAISATTTTEQEIARVETLIKKMDCLDMARAEQWTAKVKPWIEANRKSIQQAKAEEARCNADPTCAGAQVALELCPAVQRREELMEEFKSQRRAAKRTGVVVTSTELGELAEEERELSDRIDALKTQYKRVAKKSFSPKVCQNIE
jgi:hypothetical protein